MTYCTGFLKSVSRGSYLLFFPAHSFKTIPEALKMIVLPTLSNNPHQQLFVEKLTDYPQVIGQKLRQVNILALGFRWL